ncbi:MAG: FAD-dependent monooxygenase [Bacteroidetes bacterium]|nr:FAD-dependent monooxygenase [Bacteroidota bacterium]
MGFKIIEIKAPSGYSDEELRRRIGKELRLTDFTWQIETKSLDARKKSSIHWLLRIAVFSKSLGGKEPEKAAPLDIPYKPRNKRVIITGSGPAGFFAALLLQQAGFDTVILERGADVAKRAQGIIQFEKTGQFNPAANYAFGEGGAGTFSDGKLTSRSKHISAERDFFISSYIDAGAPAEIRYMSSPHVGSDNLRIVIKNLRDRYRQSGGEIRFETTLDDLVIQPGRVAAAIAGGESLEGDYFIMAPGHSAYETYRMLIARGVQFRTKNFAIGCRAEHRQEEINRSQWGIAKLDGVKAAEYRLTSEADGKHPVYSFCMCPGGVVVPAATYSHVNIVNGMSNYRRNGQFANAGCVAGIHPDQLAGRGVTALEALQWLEDLEHSFFAYSGDYTAPFCTISDFIQGNEPRSVPETSYPLGLKPAPLYNMLPAVVTHALREGLRDFDHRLRGYGNGILLGLESKTSSPIQVLREKNGLCTGFDNLFLAGEGSGYAGGIVSSAADGIRIAMQILASHK